MCHFKIITFNNLLIIILLKEFELRKVYVAPKESRTNFSRKVERGLVQDLLKLLSRHSTHELRESLKIFRHHSWSQSTLKPDTRITLITAGR
jgi:hypothetical protein